VIEVLEEKFPSQKRFDLNPRSQSAQEKGLPLMAALEIRFWMIRFYSGPALDAGGS
jgi:hypothetical protein